MSEKISTEVIEDAVLYELRCAFMAQDDTEGLDEDMDAWITYWSGYEDGARNVYSTILKEYYQDKECETGWIHNDDFDVNIYEVNDLEFYTQEEKEDEESFVVNTCFGDKVALSANTPTAKQILAWAQCLSDASDTVAESCEVYTRPYMQVLADQFISRLSFQSTQATAENNAANIEEGIAEAIMAILIIAQHNDVDWDEVFKLFCERDIEMFLTIDEITPREA